MTIIQSAAATDQAHIRGKMHKPVLRKQSCVIVSMFDNIAYKATSSPNIRLLFSSGSCQFYRLRRHTEQNQRVSRYCMAILSYAGAILFTGNEKILVSIHRIYRYQQMEYMTHDYPVQHCVNTTARPQSSLRPLAPLLRLFTMSSSIISHFDINSLIQAIKIVLVRYINFENVCYTNKQCGMI